MARKKVETAVSSPGTKAVPEAANPGADSLVASGTLTPTMEEQIAAVLKAAPTRSMKWWDLVAKVGPWAQGSCYLQLSETGVRDHNILVWYDVSKDFHDAILKMREEKRIRLFPVSPVGYFPAATTPPMPLTYDYRLSHHKPHLFLTEVELSS